MCINKAISTNDSKKQPWPVGFSCGVCISTYWQQSSPAHISLETSNSCMKHQVRCACIAWYLFIDWETLVMSCMHRPSDFSQWQAISTNVFTHLTWLLRQWKAMSCNGIKYYLRHARITLGVCASDERNRGRTMRDTISQVKFVLSHSKSQIPNLERHMMN